MRKSRRGGKSRGLLCQVQGARYCADWRRLNERTLSEMQVYERTKRELENEKSSEIWEQKNEALRTLGLRTIPLPEER